MVVVVVVHRSCANARLLVQLRIIMMMLLAYPDTMNGFAGILVWLVVSTPFVAFVCV